MIMDILFLNPLYGNEARNIIPTRKIRAGGYRE